MSIRNQLLQEIHSAKGCTLADLMDGTGFDRKRLHDNLKAAIDDGLLQRTKDEITGQPFYMLTDLGAERLAAGPAKNIKPRHTQAMRGELNIHSSSASVPSSEVSHPAEGAAVATLPGGKGTPDPAGDEIAEFKGVIERLMQERINLLEALEHLTAWQRSLRAPKKTEPAKPAPASTDSQTGDLYAAFLPIEGFEVEEEA